MDDPSFVIFIMAIFTILILFIGVVMSIAFTEDIYIGENMLVDKYISNGTCYIEIDGRTFSIDPKRYNLLTLGNTYNFHARKGVITDIILSTGALTEAQQPTPIIAPIVTSGRY